MLSLKEYCTTRPGSDVTTRLTDLPDELLHQICGHLHQFTGGYTRDLIPLSVVSVRFNELIRPLLFNTIRVHLTQRYVDKRTFSILINCCLNPAFAMLIRSIIQDDSYKFREHGCEDLRLSNELTRQIVKQAIANMTSLISISTDCMNSPIFYFVKASFPDKPLHLKVTPCKCSDMSGRKDTELAKLMQSNSNHQYSIVTRKGDKLRAIPLWLEERPEKLKSLLLADLQVSIEPPYEQPATIFASFPNLTNLEELHLNFQSYDSGTTLDRLGAAIICLPRLRRLSVDGSATCDIILSIVQQLKRLESLRLNSEITRIFHAHLRNHSFEGLPYQRLPHLNRLELRYISRYLSIEHIIPQGLTHLRIEYQNRSERLTPYNLNWIAKTCPHLECLELDIGALTNLWHPTAVAGVDIDMDVYRMLDALSKFKNLRRLRLFPSYWESRAGYLYFAQPVDDMQAIKIFDHIRRICPSLQLLIISNTRFDYMARNGFSARGLSEPIKWTVRATGTCGQRMLLITEEAKRQYRLEQIWEGARKLTMKTVRHNTSRPHFDDLQEWTIAPFEFRFDEPLPCHWDVTSSFWSQGAEG